MFYRMTAVFVLCFLGITLAQQSVTLEFSALVGDQEAACSVRYDGVGAQASQIVFQDLRFYVSNLRLINAAGEEVALELAPPGCMSGAGDPDCSVLFANLSLGGADAQTFFRSEAKE